jgi:hypothetical protein
MSAQDIVGIVTDELSGLPVPGASVRLYSDGMPGGRTAPSWVTAIASDDGKFVFPKVAVGKYSLDFAKSGYLFQERSFRAPSVEAKSDGSVDPVLVKILLTPQAVLSGFVLTEDGRPLDKAVVKTLFGRESARTDATGAFELAELRGCEKDCQLLITIEEPSRLSMLMKDGNRTLGPPDWTVQQIGPWNMGQQVRNLQLRIPMERLVSFSGTLSGTPEDHMVKLVREGPNEHTTPEQPLTNGKFSFSLVPVGNYRLVVSKAKEYVSVPSEVRVRIDSDLIDQQIELPKPRSISGVAKLDGKPFYQPGYDVTLTLRADGGSYRMARGKLREDGTFQITGIIPGKWMVSLSATARSADALRKMTVRIRHMKPLEIVDGDHPPLVVELVRTFNVSGRMLGSDGLPVVGSVILKNAEGTNVFPSDNFGNFGSSLIPGTYQITAWKRGDAVDFKNPLPCPTAKMIEITEDLEKLDLRVCR